MMLFSQATRAFSRSALCSQTTRAVSSSATHPRVSATANGVEYRSGARPLVGICLDGCSQDYMDAAIEVRLVARAHASFKI
jgi:hypothetical protein